MITKLILIPAMAVLGVSLPIAVQAETDKTKAVLQIDASQVKGKVSPLFYGLMTEEISHSYDGGLYAELIQNRVFKDDTKTPVHWSLVQSLNQNKPDGLIMLDSVQPLSAALPVSLRLEARRASEAQPVGIANEGYWGIPVKANTSYQASFYARTDGSFHGPITVRIESNDGKRVFAESIVSKVTGEWQKYSVVLQTGPNVESSTSNRLVMTVKTPGTLWFNLVSLFPPTWKDRPNGLRMDLMQMLSDLKPAFLRFPGGNYLEGGSIENRFDWKKTLGPLSDRPGHPGPWGYRSTDGMGLLEFLLWCEDLGAEPVLAVYAGYSLNHDLVKPGPDLDPYIQDVLDEIEYVTGPVTSKWGAQRAKDGHPEPFSLHYVEIGNEDFFDGSRSYDGRFAQFQDAIKAKYPKLKLISTVGNDQPPELRVRSRKPDVLDEHYYRSTDEFLKISPDYYEGYDRKGPEIFVGEWAAYETDFPPWDQRSKSLIATPNMKAALGDAAWMAAMERNSDLVVMQSYAPLFANINKGAYQWRPNLIGYDALHSYGSPSYYVFLMFSNHHGDEILKATISDLSLPYSVTRDSKTGIITAKVVNPEPKPLAIKIEIQGIASLFPAATMVTLSTQPNDTNSIGEPRKVVPFTREIPKINSDSTFVLPPDSINVLQLKPGS